MNDKSILIYSHGYILALGIYQLFPRQAIGYPSRKL